MITKNSSLSKTLQYHIKEASLLLERTVAEKRGQKILNVVFVKNVTKDVVCPFRG